MRLDRIGEPLIAIWNKFIYITHLISNLISNLKNWTHARFILVFETANFNKNFTEDRTRRAEQKTSQVPSD